MRMTPIMCDQAAWATGESRIMLHPVAFETMTIKDALAAQGENR
jgi:hypothetical protein